MKLADVMSAMHFSLFAQIALIIALIGFSVAVVTTFLARNREPFRRASLLPLADDQPARTPGGQA
jgi:cbb3-type cytochrome oxidase subunit 3